MNIFSFQNGAGNLPSITSILCGQDRKVFYVNVISIACNVGEDEICRTIQFTDYGIMKYITTTNSESLLSYVRSTLCNKSV